MDYDYFLCFRKPVLFNSEGWILSKLKYLFQIFRCGAEPCHSCRPAVPVPAGAFPLVLRGHLGGAGSQGGRHQAVRGGLAAARRPCHGVDGERSAREGALSPGPRHTLPHRHPGEGQARPVAHP